MNDAAYVDYGPQITPVTSSPLWAAAPAGMEQYWAWNDPRWGQFGISPETNKYPINDVWDQLLKSTGFQGKLYEEGWTDAYDEVGNLIAVPFTGGRTPEAKAAMDQLRAKGYDVRQKNPDRRTFNTYYGIVTPQGVQEVKIKGSDMGTALQEMAKFAPYMLAFVGGVTGLNALLGGAGAAGAGAGVGAGTAVGAANALTPAAIEAGLGTAGYGFNAGAAASGAFAPTAIGAGAALPFESILSSGGGTGALTASDLATLPDSALGQAVSAPGDSGVAGVADATSATEIRGGAGAGTGADSAAIRDSLYGAEGYGAGMTGAQTSAYDTILGATGSKTAADVASNVVGAGGSILDKAIDLIKSPAGGAILSGVGSVVGGVAQANAAEEVANQQAEAARNALALQREMFEYQKSLLEPYRTAGTAALKRLEGALGLGGAAQPQQTLEMDPGYGFRLGEGMKALERMQSARGSMLSGGAMKAGQRYAQDYASGEYGNAYNRLANIAGLGQTVGGQLGTAAQQFGTSAGNVMGQEANALAAGRIGRGSAYSGAIQGGLNAYSNYLNQQQQNQLFRDIFGRTAIGG